MGDQDTVLKGLMHKFILNSSHSLRIAWVIIGFELTDFRTSSKRAGTLSGERGTSQHHCFFVSFVVLSFHLANLVQEGAKSAISIKVTKTVCLALTFS